MKSSFSLALISACFLIGAVAGSLIAMTVSDGAELTDFFGAMVDGARDGVLQNSFWRVLLSNMLWPVLVLLFSLSPAGIVGIPACMFAKGLLVSYSVSAIFRAFGTDGLWLALASMGIPNLIYVPLLTLIALLALRSAAGAVKRPGQLVTLTAAVSVVFVGLAAYQAYFQPRVITWILGSFIT